MSAPEKDPSPRRVFFADLAAEQHQIAGRSKADKDARRLVDIHGVAKVFEKRGMRVIEPSERLAELRLRIESKFSGDDLKRFDKRRHVFILNLLKRVAIHAELRRAGVADEKSYAAIGRAAVELIGVPLNPASRDSVLDLRDDCMLALEKFDRINKRQFSLSKEGAMKLAVLNFTEDYLTRTLKLPAECEVRNHLEARGYEYCGATRKNIERQWNRLLQWWREVFLVSEKGQT